LGTVATQRGLTEATMQETIQAGANRLEAQAKELYAQAEEATAQATTLQDEWKRGFEEKKFAADEAYRYRDTTTDGGMQALQLLLGAGGAVPTTPKPQMSAAAGTVQGEWVATGQDANDYTVWEPAGGQATMESIFSDPEKVAALVMAEPKNASNYLAIAKTFETEISTGEKDRAVAVQIIKGTAQQVLDVVTNKKMYATEEEYMNALRYAVSDYNKRGFTEGGKALTPSEQAVIAGTQIRTTPGRQAGFFHKLIGTTPASASSVNINDDEQSIIDKMNSAIQGASKIETSVKPVESWVPK